MALIWYILIRLFDLTLFRWITDGLSSLELCVGERLQEFACLGDDPGIVTVLDGVQLLMDGHPVDDMALCFQGLGYDPGNAVGACLRMNWSSLPLTSIMVGESIVFICYPFLLLLFVTVFCYCKYILVLRTIQNIYTQFVYGNR
ncbi:Uncharacterised protein [Sphingobacterium daejeonense]|nr:Uncharacterised protein [Sphingobacterium daejeonense]